MSDETPVDVALAQAVIDNFHCPDDKHSSWWLNADELRHAFVPILSAHEEAVRAEERERIARNIEAMPGATRSYIAGRPGAFVTRDRAARIAREGA